MFLISKPVYPIDFQRAIVFVQSRLDFDMMPLMLSYSLRVLDAVPLFIFIAFQYIIVAIPPNVP
jgi:hypothetical protein